MVIDAVIDAEPLMKKYVSVRVLWTDIMASTINCFRGTTHEDAFLIDHDGLLKLTCTATKAWLKTQLHDGRTLFDIWIKPELELNKETAYVRRAARGELARDDVSWLLAAGEPRARPVADQGAAIGRPAEVFPLNTTAVHLFSDAPPVADLRRRGAGVRCCSG